MSDIQIKDPETRSERLADSASQRLEVHNSIVYSQMSSKSPAYETVTENVAKSVSSSLHSRSTS